MMDWKLCDTLTLFEKMCGMNPIYLSDAVKSGNVKSITLSFDIEKDEHGVATQLQHFVDVEWNK